MPRKVRSTGSIGRRPSSSLGRVTGQAPTSFLSGRMAPKFSFTVTGMQSVDRAFQMLLRNSRSATYNAIRAATAILYKEMASLIKSGPLKAYDTGALYRSIKSEMERYTQNEIYGVAGSFGVKYAIYVHDGSQGRWPKPFANVAITRKKALIKKMIKKAISEDIVKGRLILGA